MGGVSTAADVVGNSAQDIAKYISPDQGVGAGAFFHTAVVVAGSFLVSGVALAGATTELPGDIAAAKENVVKGVESGDALQVSVGALHGLKAAGTIADWVLLGFMTARLPPTKPRVFTHQDRFVGETATAIPLCQHNVRHLSL